MLCEGCKIVGRDLFAEVTYNREERKLWNTGRAPEQQETEYPRAHAQDTMRYQRKYQVSPQEALTRGGGLLLPRGCGQCEGCLWCCRPWLGGKKEGAPGERAQALRLRPCHPSTPPNQRLPAAALGPGLRTRGRKPPE